MKRGLLIGAVAELLFKVEPQHTIDFAGMPRVLSTPNLIGWLERAAREAMAPALAEGESSVGMEIELQHVAPSPLGSSIRCRVRVVHVEGRVISFQLEAHEGLETIARGFHKRFIVQIEKFAARVARSKE